MIPKIIHYCWISDEPYPELNRKCIESWKEYLQDYQFILWDKTKVSLLKSSWLDQSVASGKFAFAADFIRAYALFNVGGIYLDTDVELVQSFDQFIKYEMFIGFDTNNDLEPAVIGAEPQYGLLEDLLQYYNKRSFLKTDGRPDLRPLPIIFNEVVSYRYPLKMNGELQFFNSGNLAFYPCSYFSPKNIYLKKIRIASETVSIHHFSGSWVKKNLKYYLKQSLHRFVFQICGSQIHNQIVQTFRRVIG